MKNDTPAIVLTNINKIYTIQHEKPTLVEKLVTKRETFQALKDVTITINKGERVGIIGPNGSGKTSLLKIIAGITTPTSGSMQVNGNIVSLIDLEAGFHSDLTGEQNIYLNGLLLGMSRSEISRKIKAIIDFADIGNFIDAPLFTYSAGMKLRLGFSIATNAKPDILILDEGLSYGDKSFTKKAIKKIRSFIHNQCTILLVSHQYETISEICTSFIGLKQGEIIVRDSITSLHDHLSLL